VPATEKLITIWQHRLVPRRVSFSLKMHSHFLRAMLIQGRLFRVLENARRIFLRAMLIRGSKSVLFAGMPFVRRE